MSDLRVKTEHFELWNSAENYLAGESEKIKAKKIRRKRRWIYCEP
jgi:hypothetical protein